MRVFVTGGTGFVGSEVLRQLSAAGHGVRCLVRPGSESRLAVEGAEIHHGDATDPKSLQGALEGCDAVIHLVGIIREFPGKGITFKKLHFEATRNMVEAAELQGVKRYLQMSANGTRKEAETTYHQTKWQAETTVRASSLDWTIFRPSLIFGPGDAFVNLIANIMAKLPVMPVVGDGRYRMTPVAVEDVATGFVRALDREEAIGKIYHCCGLQTFTYDQILDLVGEALGKKSVCKIHQPAGLMRPFVSLLEAFPRFPLTTGQMTMLLEGNVCDPTQWAETFGITPRPFAEGIKKFLQP